LPPLLTHRVQERELFDPVARIKRLHAPFGAP
jgi:hypothetical protein